MTIMNNAQSGNILIYILIAVALLASLSYAVTQSTRGSANISAERARLFAGEIIDIASSMASGVEQLRLRGVNTEDLCFNHASWGGANYNHGGCGDTQTHLYTPEGAGLNWALAPSGAMDAAATPDNLWHFYSDNEIENVGTTSGDAAGVDLIVMVDELSLTVCQQINDLLGVTDASTAPPSDTGYGATRFTGTFSYTATIGDEDAALAGKNAACFLNTTTGEYAFYKVLLAR
jgi:hypothetical protein